MPKDSSHCSVLSVFQVVLPKSNMNAGISKHHIVIPANQTKEDTFFQNFNQKERCIKSYWSIPELLAVPKDMLNNLG